jgi:hypothetical protein
MKKLRFLLLDTGPILKLFELGIWDTFIQRYDVSIARTVVEQALYTPDGTQHIDLTPYEEKGLIKVIEVDLPVVENFVNQLGAKYKSDIHAGEKETLAFLFGSSEDWLLCSADRTVFRVLGLFGKAEQGISLEEALAKIGLSQNLEWRFTKCFRLHYAKKGQIDSIQDQDLNR